MIPEVTAPDGLARFLGASVFSDSFMAPTASVFTQLLLLLPVLATDIRSRDYSGWAADGVIDRRQASGLFDNNPYWNYEVRRNSLCSSPYLDPDTLTVVGLRMARHASGL